jgi:putative N6-adenine-specific DNA methylase
MDEQEENAEADIRSFKFRSLEKKDFQSNRDDRDSREFKGRKERGNRDFKSREERDSKGRSSHDRFDHNGGKKPFKNNRDFGRKNRRFDDDKD